MWISKFVSISEVNIDAITPKDNVIENPFMGPDPKTNTSKDAIKVVILASKIVESALSNPFLIVS